MTSATIVLHQFAPMYGLPNPSPFCIKLETYLRLAKLEYTVATLKGPPRSPTGKAPYIEIDGEVLCDSGLIVAELERPRAALLDHERGPRGVEQLADPLKHGL